MPLIHPTKISAVANDLRHLLNKEKVLDDGPSITAYSVDASIYKIKPKAIVLVETEEDISRVVNYAVQNAVPVTPRAAGTNLTGSAIGSGIIIDISRMNQILEVNREEQWARVQPGMVYAELNRRLISQKLHFGPDPSSGDMCKLGGMLANNSSGPHTLHYGSVKDNVRGMRVCLPCGTWVEARTLDRYSAECIHLLSAHPSLQDIIHLTESHADLIREKRPRVSKNSCGYNLFDLVDGLDRQLVDLPKLFVGSEGTLGIMSEATLSLAPRPLAITTAMIHFQHLEEVGAAVPQLLELHPSALEVMDANTLNLIGRENHGIPPHSEATLLAEFYHEDAKDSVKDTEDRIHGLCRRFRLAGPLLLATDPARRDQLWTARKALYPTLYRYDGKKKPINYVDDVVVPAEQIGELVQYLEEYFQEQGVPVAVFGHIGNGNAHVVPLLDINDTDDFTRMVQGYEDIHATVLNRFKGSICGEHGDGRVRAEFVRRMFGEELYALFVRVKELVDPSGVMNPGVKISQGSFTEHIDFQRLSKPCATCAKCNSVCPVYDVFQSEDMSARGWFEIVTADDYQYLESQRVIESCLNCKSCRDICPAGVDVSELILQRRAEHPNSITAALFSLHATPRIFEPLLQLAARTQILWDQLWPRLALDWLTRPFLKRIARTARIPASLILPRLAKRHLRTRYADFVPKQGTQDVRSVAYFHGCAANYFDDGVGDAVIAVLQKLGMDPALPSQRCSGTPIQTYGHVNLVKECARENLAHLDSYQTIVTGCASCTLMLKDYPTLFAQDPELPQARRMAAKVKHVSEIVAERLPLQSGSGQEQGLKQTLTYHSSCHLRAAGVTGAPRRVLQSLPGYHVVEMQDAERCAGGAGTYLVKDPGMAQDIFDRKRRAIVESKAEIVATSCPACMIQLKNGMRGTVEVRHIAELVNKAMDGQAVH